MPRAKSGKHVSKLTVDRTVDYEERRLNGRTSLSVLGQAAPGDGRQSPGQARPGRPGQEVSGLYVGNAAAWSSTCEEEPRGARSLELEQGEEFRRQGLSRTRGREAGAGPGGSGRTPATSSRRTSPSHATRPPATTTETEEGRERRGTRRSGSATSSAGSAATRPPETSATIRGEARRRREEEALDPAGRHGGGPPGPGSWRRPRRPWPAAAGITVLPGLALVVPIDGRGGDGGVGIGLHPESDRESRGGRARPPPPSKSLGRGRSPSCSRLPRHRAVLYDPGALRQQERALLEAGANPSRGTAGGRFPGRRRPGG